MVLSGVTDGREDRDTSEPDYEPVLDVSLDEWQLSLEDPVGYGYRVNGIRQILVRDESIEIRYVMKDGEAQLKDIKVW